MTERRNFSVETVRVKQDIDCRGWVATPNDKWKKRKGEGILTFDTEMPTRQNVSGKWKHSKIVEVRDTDKLAVWVHNYTFDHANRTSATLIFAALDGRIDGGLLSKTLPWNSSTKSISSIACDVAVEMVEDTLTVSKAPGPATRINSLANIFVKGQNKTSHGITRRTNELALWFAVAPVANGAYVYGAHPMYKYVPSWLPERYTSTNKGGNDAWTIEYIKKFIRVSTGAALLGEVRKFAIHTDTEDGKIEDTKKPQTVRFPSYVPIIKMDPNKPILLLMLPLVVFGCGSLLMIWNIKMHRSMAIPIMRKATLDEILKSSQTDAVLVPAAIDKLDATKPSSLGKLCLRFSEGDDELWGLHSAKERP